MKRTIAIVLVFLYTVSVSGMVMIKHYYCKDNLVEFIETESEDDCCAVEEDLCNTDCCLEKAEVLKVDVPHEKMESLKILKLNIPLTLLSVNSSFLSLVVGAVTSASEIKTFSYPPPKVPARVLHSVFRL